MKIKHFQRRHPRPPRKNSSEFFQWLKKKISRFFLFFRNTKSYRWWLLYSFYSFLIILVTLFGYTVFFLPDVKDAKQLSFSESTVIYSREALDPTKNPADYILYTIHGEENREYIPLEEISPWLKLATIAIEDDGFYSHFGFDLGGIIKGFLNYAFDIGKTRGGSTITQQLVKNTFLTREKTLARKINELLLSMKVEFYYSKDDILELYLNKIPYGHNTAGAEAASRKFFSKSAKDLSLAESVILASLPVAPSRFSPYSSSIDLLMGFYEDNPDTGVREYKKGRKDLVLQRMLDLGYISQSDFNTAWSEAHKIEFKQNTIDIKAPHFVFYIREQLENKFGKNILREGGFKIYTSLSLDWQEKAEEIVAERMAFYPIQFGAQNMALTVIDNDTGEILVYVGGSNFFDTKNDGQVDVLRSRRQPGSSFKPFTYATAFTQGYSPATVLFDVETDFGGNYVPQNFDGNFLGPVTAREALGRSLNIPAIKMAYLGGPGNILKLAKAIGIKFEGDAKKHSVALGVGVAEVEPLSHINAYRLFANDARVSPPVSVLEIHDKNNVILEKFEPKKFRENLPKVDSTIVNKNSFALVRNILTDASSRPTTDEFDWNILLKLPDWSPQSNYANEESRKISWENGAKTGTSNRVIRNPNFEESVPENEKSNPRDISVPGDAWTIGFTPYVTAGVWVGNNKGEPMKSGSTGLAIAAPAWKRIMEMVNSELVAQEVVPPFQKYPQESKLERRKVNKYSGKLAKSDTPESLITEELFDPHWVPTEFDDSVQLIDFDQITGRQADNKTPSYAISKRKSLVLSSIRPKLENWVSPVEEWLQNHPKFLFSLGDREKISDNDSEDIVPEVDNLHSEFGEPFKDAEVNFRILSPQNNSVIPTGKFKADVQVIGDASHIASMEFLWNDSRIRLIRRAPWTTEFNIPLSTPLKSQHKLTVSITTNSGNVLQRFSHLTIGKDEKGPDIQLLGISQNQLIARDTNISVAVEVVDDYSDIGEVNLYLDDVFVASHDSAPFYYQIPAIAEEGAHHIKIIANDLGGNVSTKVIPIVVRDILIPSEKYGILDITSHKNSFQISTNHQQENVDYIELVLKNIDEGNIFYTQKARNVGKKIDWYIPYEKAINTEAVNIEAQLFAKHKNQSSLVLLDRFIISQDTP